MAFSREHILTHPRKGCNSEVPETPAPHHPYSLRGGSHGTFPCIIWRARALPGGRRDELKAASPGRRARPLGEPAPSPVPDLRGVHALQRVADVPGGLV